MNTTHDTIAVREYGIAAAERPLFHIRFTEALSFTAQLHSNQLRKGTNIPYISHLLSVAALVLEYGGDADEAIAALLHDAVEDQGGPPTQLAVEHRFGTRVAQIVAGCSDTDVTPKPPWRERKEAYIRHLRESETSRSVRLVSCADKLHNARAILKDYRQIGEDLWGRFNAGRDDVLWYYLELGNTFQESLDSSLVLEFTQTVAELEHAISGR